MSADRQSMVRRDSTRRSDAAKSDAATPQTSVVQRSLVVGASGDAFEREADEVAAEIIDRIAGVATAVPPEGDEQAGRVRRSSAVVRSGPESIAAADRIQRIVHRGGVGPEGGEVGADVESRINVARGAGRPMPTDVGGKMQRAFGADLGRVRLHDDAESHDLNRSMQARAFTTNNDIFLGDSAPTLSSSAGMKLLAHELTHVVQQGGGVQRSTDVDVAADRSGVVRRVTQPGDLAAAQLRATGALAAHRKDRAALMKIVRAGAKSSDRRTKNACQWILDGRTKLYALNATGDRDDRIAHLGEDPTTTETWFPEGNGGPGDLNDAVAAYNPLDLDDQANVCIDTDDGPSTNGWNGAGFIAVMMGGGQMKKATVLETLRHEVQHDADKNRVKEQNAVAIVGDVQADADDMAKCFEAYKTEYRAYTYQGTSGRSYNRLSATKVVTKYGFKWSERQLEIFEQIHWGYEHTQQFWDDSFESGTWAAAHPGKDGPDDPSDKNSYHDATIGAQWKASIEARRRALVDYLNPDEEGFNKYDSVRVDDFYKALEAVPLGSADSDVKPIHILMWKIGGLGKKDARYVLEQSVDLRKKLKAHLIDEAYVSIFKALCVVAGVKKATPIQKMGSFDQKTIQAFSEALDAVPLATSDPKHPSIRNLRYKTAKLSKKEAKQVLEHEPKLLNQIERHVTGQVHTDLMALLNLCLG